MARVNGPFVANEWYHCHNRGIEGRTSFEDLQDYQRFLELLYLANDEAPLRRGDIGARTFREILRAPRDAALVAIGAFCLMPDRFDLVLREVSAGGITAFMRKLGTAYTLYFNARHKRTGNLFLKPFQSGHVPAGRPLQHIVSFIHSNPATLYEPRWKANHVVDPQFLEERLTAYPYSSFAAHAGTPAPTRAILDAQFLSTARVLPLQKMLQEARQYAADSDAS